MLTVRKSGKHLIGSRRRAAGYETKSGWNKAKAGDALALRKDWDPSDVPVSSSHGSGKKREGGIAGYTCCISHLELTNLSWLQGLGCHSCIRNMLRLLSLSEVNPNQTAEPKPNHEEPNRPKQPATNCALARMRPGGPEHQQKHIEFVSSLPRPALCAPARSSWLVVLVRLVFRFGVWAPSQTTKNQTDQSNQPRTARWRA
jgi:hypothetical protein